MEHTSEEAVLSKRVTHEDLMRYLDGEVDAAERARIEAALESSTELRRELEVYRALQAELRGLALPSEPAGGSVWHAVHRQIARPLAWLLIVFGALVWTAYGAYLFLTSSVFLLEKLATGAIGIGILILLASVILERYRESLSDPYRDVQR